MEYFISDLHFYSKNQTKQGHNWDGRPFEDLDEMHSYMLERWNAKVTNADTVYILGDVSLRGKSDALIAMVAQLKGRKILIQGNHDDLNDYRYRQLFEEVVPYEEIGVAFGGKNYKLALCHYPILMWSGQHRGTILLYGHTHNSVEDTFFQECIAKMNQSEELSLRRQGGQKLIAINVGACMPYIQYEPRTFREIYEATQGVENHAKT